MYSHDCAKIIKKPVIFIHYNITTDQFTEEIPEKETREFDILRDLK